MIIFRLCKELSKLKKYKISNVVKKWARYINMNFSTLGHLFESQKEKESVGLSTAAAVPDGSLEPGASSISPTWEKGPKPLSFLPLFSAVYWQKAESQVSLPGQEFQGV